MFLFVCFIIFALLTAMALLGYLLINDKETGMLLLPISLGVIAAIFLTFASTTIVSTKNVGVTTTFGKPTGTLTNGLHVKAPWSKVTELDGAIQNDHQNTDVRLGNNSMAGVENTVQWRIKADDADDLFLNYRTFDSIKSNLVERQLNASLNEVFASYNPLDPNFAAEGGADLNKLSQLVADDLRKRVDGKVEILNVIIPVVRFDEQTQSKLDAYQQEIGNTRIAEQKEQTAIAEAKANRELSASVNNDPNVLVSKCLDIWKQVGGSPLGCWPGTTTVIPAK